MPARVRLVMPAAWQVVQAGAVRTGGAKAAAAGTIPTVDTVRAALGDTGSKSTNGPYLNRWKAEQEGEKATAIAGLPVELLEAVKSVHELVQADAAPGRAGARRAQCGAGSCARVAAAMPGARRHAVAVGRLAVGRVGAQDGAAGHSAGDSPVGPERAGHPVVGQRRHRASLGRPGVRCAKRRRIFRGLQAAQTNSALALDFLQILLVVVVQLRAVSGG